MTTEHKKHLLQTRIISQLLRSHNPEPGQWQASLSAHERAGMVLSMRSAVMLSAPGVDEQQATQTAVGVENACLVEGESKEGYFRAINEQLRLYHGLALHNSQMTAPAVKPNGNNATHLQQGPGTTIEPPPQRPTLEQELASQIRTALEMKNMRQRRDDDWSSVQAVWNDWVSYSPTCSSPEFESTPPPSGTVPEPTQPPSHAPGSRPFQHHPSPAAQEWKRQKRKERAYNTVIDELMGLVGLEKVKEQVLAIRDKVEVYRKQGADIKKERFNVIFQGNPGTGKTTVARLYARFLSSIAVLPATARVEETSGAKLAAGGIAALQQTLSKLTTTTTTTTAASTTYPTTPNNSPPSGGGVLVVDEAYQLVSPHAPPAGRQVLDLLLTEMENRVGRLVVVFAGYAGDAEALFAHNAGLASRVPYVLTFEDFGDDELWAVLRDDVARRCGDGRWGGKKKAAAVAKMRVEGGVGGVYARVAVRRLGRGRGGRGFGNARAVENLVARVAGRQAVRVKKEERSGGRPDHFLLTKADLLGPDPAGFQSEAWTRLQGMVGLEAVKQSVRNMIAMVEQNYRREMAEIKPLQVSLNQVFVGSPGTGKTTVAKLYGQILADLGLLSKGDVVLKNPSDFIGDFVGKSEANTRGILAATAGKVLIIDEAYMLDSSGSDAASAAPHGHQDSFKTGVIDTLVAEVQGTLGEDRCIILAGYEDKMQALFRNSNPGLARRFPVIESGAFRFADYTVDELMAVLELKMREQDVRATGGALDVAREVLERALMRPSFSNAGEVERCLAAAKSNYEARQARRPVGEREFDTLLEAEDFDPERGRMADDGARKMLEGLVDDAVIEKLEECRQVWQGAKARNCDPRELVSTRFVFKGGPGTGKTTAARATARIFHHLGLLASPTDIIECTAADLIGQYVGQTAPKARAQLSKGLGKVLVLDDVHQLRSSNNNKGTFTAEALDALVAFLNNNPPHRLVVVLVGPTQGVDALMAEAPALAALFPEELVFADLEPSACVGLLGRELRRLAVLPRGEGEGDVLPLFLSDWQNVGYVALAAVFEELRRLPSWSNARDVRALATKIARAHMVAACRRRGDGGGDGAELALDVMVEKCAQDMLKTRRGRREGGGCGGDAGSVVGQPSRWQEQQPMQTEMAAASPPLPPPVVQTAQAVDEETARVVDEGMADARVEDEEDERKDERSEQDTQALLRQMGRCCAGFRWRKEVSGWRCEGGTHYVSDKELDAFT